MSKKLRNFLADLDDYCGWHFLADTMRNENPSKKRIIFDILTLWNVPFSYLLMALASGKLHKPNCDCNEMKHLKWLNDKLKNNKGEK